MKKGHILSAAILFAANAHKDQFDRGGNPYILHPLRVVDLLDLSGVATESHEMISER